ncbi:MAG: hypothetical protein EZS28_036705, partial [Streblomastix strix]
MATIKNLTVQGEMPGRGDGASGLFGLAKSSYITNVYMKVNVEGITDISGFGQTTGNSEFQTIFVNCSNEGNIVAQNSFAGGFASHAVYTQILNSYNKGSISVAKNHAGGFIGFGDYVRFDSVIGYGTITPFSTALADSSAHVIGEIVYRSLLPSNRVIAALPGGSSSPIVASVIKVGNTRIEFKTGDFMTYRGLIFDGNGLQTYPLSTTLTSNLNTYTSKLKENPLLTTRIDYLTKVDIQWFKYFSSTDIHFQDERYPTDFPTVDIFEPDFISTEVNGHLNQDSKYDIFYKDTLSLTLYPENSISFDHYEYKTSPDNLDWSDYIELDLGVNKVVFEDSYYLHVYCRNIYGAYSAYTSIKITKTGDAPTDPEVKSAIYKYYDNSGEVAETEYTNKASIPGPNINKPYYALETMIYIDAVSTASKTDVVKYEYATNLISPNWTEITNTLTDGVLYFTLSQDKEHIIYVHAVNSWGVPSEPVRIDVIIDGAIPKSPVISKSYQTEWVIEEATLYFSAESSNISPDGFHFEYRTIRYAGDDPVWTPLGEPVDYLSQLTIKAHTEQQPNVNAEGTYNVQVRTVSRSGVPSEKTSELIKIDGAAPIISILSSNTTNPATSINLSISASDEFGIGKMNYGWGKVLSFEDIDSAVINWNDELTYQVDENNAYYIAWVKDGLGQENHTYYHVENFQAVRPSSPIMRSQVLLVTKTPGNDLSWTPYNISSQNFIDRSGYGTANVNALVDL